MNNKKGFTLVELIVSFALITTISLVFFKTILSLQQQQLENIARNNFKSFTIVLNNSIQKDFLNDNIEKIISCGENCYDITYTANGIVRLSVDKENGTITYGSIKEKLPNDYKFIGNIEFTSYINNFEGNDSYIALNLNLKSNYESKIENIKYLYQYDSDNQIIELDVDGAEASDIIEYLLYSSPEGNGLYEPLLPDGTSTGIRYRGSNPNNYVYFNCEDTDTSSVAYGEDGYDYANFCEVWRIIGVFDVDNGKGNIEKRVKLINAASTFRASWDSCATDVNSGYGINQWGESTYVDGTSYEGADLMQLLNGYYIGKEGSTCTYCNGYKQETCSQLCTAESLISANMKTLTTKAKNMIENAKWSTYAVKSPNEGLSILSWAPTAYLQEKGITQQNTGKNLCATVNIYCNDTVFRTTSWTGFVGLISVSDIAYTDGWLYNISETMKTLSPQAIVGSASFVLAERDAHIIDKSSAADVMNVYPSLYLKSSVTFIGDGDGTEDSPYILGINE